MKINNKKITIVSLALAMGAALAGSVSGSVAWYQYSTRAAASLQGTSAGTSRNLQIAAETGAASANTWKQYVDNNDVIGKSTTVGTGDLAPVSAVVNSGAVESFVAHPVYQYAELPEATEGWLEYSLFFQCLDADKANSTPHRVAKDVYITKFDIVNNETDGSDITPAVRVALEQGTSFKHIYAQSEVTTLTSGNLDVNGNGVLDAMDLDQKDANTSKITYAADPAQASYDAEATSAIVANFGTDPYSDPTGGAVVFTTSATDAVELKVKVWVEGWQELNSKNCWDLNKTLAKSFHIDMRFEVKAEK